MVGCKDNKYDEYNGDADYDDGASCFTLRGTDIQFSGKAKNVHFTGRNVTVNTRGRHSLCIYSLDGKQLFRQSGRDRYVYTFPETAKAGLYLVSIEAEQQRFSRMVMFP